jgi:SOS response regulatory protein OraA/RecX
LRKLRGFKLQEDEIPQHLEWIESVLDHCQQKGIIDHDRYAGILQRDLQRRNKGKRYVAQKMKERGLEEEFRKIDFDPEEELARAEALAAKTLDRGSIRKLEDERKIRDKVLQKLLASGFEPGIAIKAADRVLRSR